MTAKDLYAADIFLPLAAQRVGKATVILILVIRSGEQSGQACTDSIIFPAFTLILHPTEKGCQRRIQQAPQLQVFCQFSVGCHQQHSTAESHGKGFHLQTLNQAVCFLFKALQISPPSLPTPVSLMWLIYIFKSFIGSLSSFYHELKSIWVKILQDFIHNGGQGLCKLMYSFQIVFSSQLSSLESNSTSDWEIIASAWLGCFVHLPLKKKNLQALVSPYLKMRL